MSEAFTLITPVPRRHIRWPQDDFGADRVIVIDEFHWRRSESLPRKWPQPLERMLSRRQYRSACPVERVIRNRKRRRYRSIAHALDSRCIALLFTSFSAASITALPSFDGDALTTVVCRRTDFATWLAICHGPVSRQDARVSFLE